eukprot:gene3983-6438_t
MLRLFHNSTYPTYLRMYRTLPSPTLLYPTHLNSTSVICQWWIATTADNASPHMYDEEGKKGKGRDDKGQYGSSFSSRQTDQLSDSSRVPAAVKFVQPDDSSRAHHKLILCRARVSNLEAVSLTTEALSKLFCDYEIISIDTHIDNTKDPYASVTFRYEQEASDAIDSINGEFIGERKVSVTRLESSVTRQVPPNAPSLARNGLSVSSQWQQQSQLKPYLQHKQQNGPNQRGAPQTSPPSHGQTTYQVKQTVSHNTRVNVRSSTASVSAQIPKPRWPEDGLQTDPYPQFLIENLTNNDAITFVRTPFGSWLPSESMEDVSSSGCLFECCKLNGFYANNNLSTTNFALIKEPVAVNGKPQIYNEDAKRFIQQLQAGVEAASKYGAYCSGRVVFGFSVYIVPKMLLGKNFSLSEFRQLLEDRHIRQIFCSQLPVSKGNELTQAVCRLQPIQHLGDAVIIEAQFQDDKTGLFVVSKTAGESKLVVSADHDSTNSVASLNCGKHFLMGDALETHASIVKVDPRELPPSQKKQMNRRYDLLQLEDGWFARICSGKCWSRTGTRNYKELDFVQWHLGAKPSHIPPTEPTYPTQATCFIFIGSSLDFLVMLSEVQPGSDEDAVLPSSAAAIAAGGKGAQLGHQTIEKLKAAFTDRV